MDTYLLKHGEWELALRALQADAAAAPPLERAGSVPILTDLHRESPAALLKRTVGRRSRVEAELQAARALTRTESAPADLEVPGDNTGDPGSTEIVLDMAVGGSASEEKGRKEGETRVEEKALSQNEPEKAPSTSESRTRASSEPVPPPQKEVEITSPLPEPGTPPNPKPAADEPQGVSPVAAASPRSRFTSLRITPPGGATHPASPRIRSPLSRSYSSPDLKVLINREAFQAAYPESSPSPDAGTPALAETLPSPKRSTSAGGSLGSTPVSEGERRVSGGSPKRELEQHSTKFVQVGKTAWVLKRPPSVSGAKGDPAAPGASPADAQNGDGKAAGPAGKDTRLENLRRMLGSDPGSYVRRLSDTSIMTDLGDPQEDGATPAQGGTPTGVPAANGIGKKTDPLRTEAEQNGRQAETPSAKEMAAAKDMGINAHKPEATADKCAPSSAPVGGGTLERGEAPNKEPKGERVRTSHCLVELPSVALPETCFQILLSCKSIGRQL